MLALQQQEKKREKIASHRNYRHKVNWKCKKIRVKVFITQRFFSLFLCTPPQTCMNAINWMQFKTFKRSRRKRKKWKCFDVMIMIYMYEHWGVSLSCCCCCWSLYKNVGGKFTFIWISHEYGGEIMHALDFYYKSFSSTQFFFVKMLSK